MSRFITAARIPFVVDKAEQEGQFYIRPTGAKEPVLQTNETGIFLWESINNGNGRANGVFVQDTELVDAVRYRYANEEGFTEEGLEDAVINWVDNAIEAGCVVLAEPLDF